MTQKLWKFYWDCGRMGYLDGLFIASQEDVNEAVGHNIYFGEVLGKHSDISGTLEKYDLEEVDIGSEAVAKILLAFGSNTLSGYNPLEVYQEAKEEGQYDDEETDDE